MIEYFCKEDKNVIMDKYQKALTEEPLKQVDFFGYRGGRNGDLNDVLKLTDMFSECPDIYKLIEFSDYKYHCDSRRGWLIMRWLMDWPGIKKNTPLFDSVAIAKEMYPISSIGNIISGYQRSNADMSVQEKMIQNLFCRGKYFNFRELYKNIPDEYCIFIEKNGKYVFNEDHNKDGKFKFGLFNIDDSYNRFVQYYKHVVIDDVIYAKYMNICILESIFISLCCFRGGRICGRFDASKEFGKIIAGRSNSGGKVCYYLFHYHFNNKVINNDMLNSNDLMLRRAAGSVMIGVDEEFGDRDRLDENAWLIGNYEFNNKSYGGYPNKKCDLLIDKLIEKGYAKRKYTLFGVHYIWWIIGLIAIGLLLYIYKSQ